MIFDYLQAKEEKACKAKKPKTMAACQERLGDLIAYFELNIAAGDRREARRTYVEWALTRDWWTEFWNAEESDHDDTDDDALAAVSCSKPGDLPRWLQAGEFIVDLDGIRARCVWEPTKFSKYLSVHAVDQNTPFISETGKWSHHYPPGQSPEKGDTVAAWVRDVVAQKLMDLKPMTEGVELDVPGWVPPRTAVTYQVDGQTHMLM